MTDEDKSSFPSAYFPFRGDGDYQWPQATVCWGDDNVVLHVHCIRDTKRKCFTLMGFLDTDEWDQIITAAYMAEVNDAEVIMFRGAGLDDGIITALMSGMGDLNGAPGSKVSHIPTPWPTRFQVKVLREAEDMSRHGSFHETSMAHRLRATPEEIHHHLEVLTDLGLMARE